MKRFILALFVVAVGMVTYSFAAAKTKPVADASCDYCGVCDDAGCECAGCD
ncbi:MAG TPA: hypothetical protein VHC22_30780 [Pirellulales bacterium]|nr:hypothetical protein [Pirellulales bacterium]